MTVGGGKPRNAFVAGFQARSGGLALATGWLVLLGTAVWLFGSLVSMPMSRETLSVVAAMGLIGVWRWSWDAVHYARFSLYVRLVFPRYRARADATPPPPSLLILVTSYRMPAEMNGAVYSALLDEVAAMGSPAVIAACVTDPADARVLQAVFRARHGLPEGTVLHLLPQDGTGKRSAMRVGLELFARLRPPTGAQVVLMDGDTLLTPGSLSATCRLLASQPDVGAVTTHNEALVRGTSLAREWYRLRMAQRHVLMGSVSLSRRLLVLTGRFAVFRAEVATAPDFIRIVERDSIEHWRLGTVQMLTGDDKSTWFITLRQGWRMLYVPDVRIQCLEEMPGNGFVSGSFGLMRRWYGNMARGNLRARRLGPARIGFFTWFCLLDQRVSPWTTLTGPAILMHAVLDGDARGVLAYSCWLLASRTLLTVLDRLATGQWHPFFPFLLYYTQLVGSLMKIYIQQHLDRQSWNRQKLRAAALETPRTLSNAFLALQLGALVLALVALGVAVEGRRPDSMAPAGCAALAPQDCLSAGFRLAPTAGSVRIPPIGP